MKTVPFGIGCTTKILSCVSERITITLLQANGSLVSNVLELYLCMTRNRRTRRILGDFYTSVQPRGTPITAEVVRGGTVGINVTWRDEEGRVASRSWSKSSGWDLPNTNGGGATLDGRN